MKKAKIMLSAIAVLAVVGGALAFKAKAAGDEANVYCRNASNACVLVYYTTLKPSPTAIPVNDPCTAAGQTVFYTENLCQTSFIETQNTVWEVD